MTALTHPRSAGLWWRWTGWVTAGETLGFSIPALAGALTATAPTIVSMPVLLAAGACEGALLGAAQAHVLHHVLPSVPRRGWIAATSAGAVVAWFLGLLPSAFADRVAGWPIFLLVLAGAALGTALLLSIGVAQWTVLRRRVDRAGRWIAVTAVGWLAGLAVFMLVAPPLWHEGQPVAAMASVGAVAGLTMAGTVAAVTGLGLVRLLDGEARR
jgi:hypothetical protein